MPRRSEQIRDTLGLRPNACPPCVSVSPYKGGDTGHGHGGLWAPCLGHGGTRLGHGTRPKAPTGPWPAPWWVDNGQGHQGRELSHPRYGATPSTPHPDRARLLSSLWF